MHTEGSIRHKLQQVRYRYLKKEIQSSVKKQPCSCKYNKELPLTEDSSIRVCGHPDQLQVCDPLYEGMKQAHSCPLFEYARDKEEVKSDFQKKLLSLSLPDLAATYPDMVALMWVLGDDQAKESILDEPVTDTALPNQIAAPEIDLSQVLLKVSPIVQTGMVEHKEPPIKEETWIQRIKRFLGVGGV